MNKSQAPEIKESTSTPKQRKKKWQWSQIEKPRANLSKGQTKAANSTEECMKPQGEGTHFRFVLTDFPSYVSGSRKQFDARYSKRSQPKHHIQTSKNKSASSVKTGAKAIAVSSGYSRDNTKTQEEIVLPILGDNRPEGGEGISTDPVGKPALVKRYSKKTSRHPIHADANESRPPTSDVQDTCKDERLNVNGQQHKKCAKKVIFVDQVNTNEGIERIELSNKTKGRRNSAKKKGRIGKGVAIRGEGERGRASKTVPVGQARWARQARQAGVKAHAGDGPLDGSAVPVPAAPAPNTSEGPPQAPLPAVPAPIPAPIPAYSTRTTLTATATATASASTPSTSASFGDSLVKSHQKSAVKAASHSRQSSSFLDQTLLVKMTVESTGRLVRGPSRGGKLFVILVTLPIHYLLSCHVRFTTAASLTSSQAEITED